MSSNNHFPILYQIRLRGRPVAVQRGPARVPDQLRERARPVRDEGPLRQGAGPGARHHVLLVAVEGRRQGQAERPRGARPDGGTSLRREGLQGAIHI